VGRRASRCGEARATNVRPHCRGTIHLRKVNRTAWPRPVQADSWAVISGNAVAAEMGLRARGRQRGYGAALVIGSLVTQTGSPCVLTNRNAGLFWYQHF